MSGAKHNETLGLAIALPGLVRLSDAQARARAGLKLLPSLPRCSGKVALGVRRKWHLRCLFLSLAILLPAAASSHTDSPPAQHIFLLTWNLEPWLLLVLFLSLAAYARGITMLWRASGAGHGLSKWRVSAFFGGWLALFAALASPLDALGALLFSAHMVQHELLMLVAAPLLVLGKPLALFAWALPSSWRKVGAWPLRTAAWQQIWRRLSAPLAAWSVHTLVIWTWHAPVLFQAGLADEAIHILQHASFLFSALLFWWALLRSRPDGAAVLYVLTTMIHTGALGALLTFAPTVWYPAYFETAPGWGITALEDQQLGGLIMWVPAGFVFLLAGLILFGQCLLAGSTASSVSGMLAEYQSSRPSILPRESAGP
jgi:putative membrane protein